MNLADFNVSLANDRPPPEASKALQALWQERKGDWEAAHKLAQAQNDAVGAWVHAYLHRVEGDERNAGYWYRRAEKPHSTTSLKEEWEEIAAALCE